jgi:hypothetical protein
MLVLINRAFTGNPQRQARIRLVSEIPREVVGTPGPGYYHERTQAKPLSLQDWKRDIAPPMQPMHTAMSLRRVKMARGGRGGRTMVGGTNGPGGRWTAQARPPTAAPSWQTLAVTLEDSAKQTNPEVAKLLQHPHKPWLARRLAALAQSSIGPGEFTLPKYFDDLSIAGRRGDLGVGVPFDRVQRSRSQRQPRDARTEGLSLIKSTMGQPGTASTLFGSAATVVTGGAMLARMVTAEVSLPPPLPEFHRAVPGTSEHEPHVHSFSSLQRFTHYVGSQPNARDLFRLREKRQRNNRQNTYVIDDGNDNNGDGTSDTKVEAKTAASSSKPTIGIHSARTSAVMASIEDAASELGLPPLDPDTADTQTSSSSPIDISSFRPETRQQLRESTIMSRESHQLEVKQRQYQLGQERQQRRAWVLDKEARQAQAAERARLGDWQRIMLFNIALMSRCKYWRDKLQARRAITSLGDLREQTVKRIIQAKDKWLYRVRLSKRVKAATIIQQMYRSVQHRRHHQRAQHAVGVIIGFFDHVRNRQMVQRMIEAMQYRRHVRRLRLQRWWRRIYLMGRARRLWLARLWEVVIQQRMDELEQYRDYLLLMCGYPIATYVPPTWHPPRRLAGHHAVGDERSIPEPQTPSSPFISMHAATATSAWLNASGARGRMNNVTATPAAAATAHRRTPSGSADNERTMIPSPPMSPGRRIGGNSARRFQSDLASTVQVLSFDDEDGNPTTMLTPAAKQATLPRYMRATIANTGKDLVSRKGGIAAGGLIGSKKGNKIMSRPVVIPVGLMVCYSSQLSVSFLFLLIRHVESLHIAYYYMGTLSSNSTSNLSCIIAKLHLFHVRCP